MVERMRWNGMGLSGDRRQFRDSSGATGDGDLARSTKLEVSSPLSDSEIVYTTIARLRMENTRLGKVQHRET